MRSAPMKAPLFRKRKGVGANGYCVAWWQLVEPEPRLRYSAALRVWCERKLDKSKG